MLESLRILEKGIVDRDFYKEETLCDYKVSQELKILWAIELDLLAEFKRVCKKYNLRWYASSGTLLGAVRHKGFIPWDDDLDVCMPREDYELLTKKYAFEFKEPYFLQTPYSDSEYCYSFAKLRNSNTSFPSEAFIESTMNQGIFFDIFPLDASSKQGYLERREQMQEIMKLCSAFMSRNNKYVINKHTELASTVKFESGDNIKFYEKIQEIAMSNEYKENCCSTEVVTIYSPEKKLWPKDCFAQVVELPFCNTTINAPVGWDEILTIMYGNYMEFPPIEKRGCWHGSKFLSVDESYKQVRLRFLKEME